MQYGYTEDNSGNTYIHISSDDLRENDYNASGFASGDFGEMARLIDQMLQEGAICSTTDAAKPLGIKIFPDGSIDVVVWKGSGFVPNYPDELPETGDPLLDSIGKLAQAYLDLLWELADANAGEDEDDQDEDIDINTDGQETAGEESGEPHTFFNSDNGNRNIPCEVVDKAIKKAGKAMVKIEMPHLDGIIDLCTSISPYREKLSIEQNTLYRKPDGDYVMILKTSPEAYEVLCAMMAEYGENADRLSWKAADDAVEEHYREHAEKICDDPVTKLAGL